MSDIAGLLAKRELGQTDHSMLDPIAGVSIELYSRVVRSIAMMNHDMSMLGPMAALHGVEGAAWDVARSGWNTRISTDEAVNCLFRELSQTA